MNHAYPLDNIYISGDEGQQDEDTCLQSAPAPHAPCTPGHIHAPAAVSTKTKHKIRQLQSC